MRRRHLAMATFVVVGLLAGCDYTGAPGGVRVMVVGESIARGAEAELRQDLGEERQVNTVLINGVWMSELQPQLPDIVADPDLRVLVIQLGVNDTAGKRTLAQLRADVRRFLRTAAPQVECVWWLEIKEELDGSQTYQENAPTFNGILHQEAALFPNVHVGPYDAWISARPQYLGKDRLHLSGAGRIAFAQWVEDSLVDSC